MPEGTNDWVCLLGLGSNSHVDMIGKYTGINQKEVSPVIAEDRCLYSSLTVPCRHRSSR
jgi:hypothetical protein